MQTRRPSPDLIAARKWEIRRRYSRKSKVGRRTRSMAAIRLAELTRWLDDEHGRGTELDPGDHAVGIARIFAHHLGALPDAPRRIKAWLDRYTPWLTLASQERLIAEVVACPLKWSADRLAWKIGLTDAKRTELKIRTIGAIDVTADQRKARRKANNARLMKELRAKRRQQREQHID